MLSRENLVVLTALLAATVLGAVLAAFDFPLNTFSLFVVYAVAILAPQLYLAYTDDDVAPRTRIRVGVLVPVLLVGPIWSTSVGLERQLTGGLLIVLVVGLLAYEVLAGYRSAATTNS